jgi:CheY-like chemotaxis protein
VVDDDDDVRKFLGITLDLEGFDAHPAASGEEAVEFLEANRPDLVILDQLMPGITGLEVAQKMRRDGYHGPAILFSAFMDRTMAAKCKRLDVHPLSKVDIDALKRVIRVLAADLNGPDS